MALIYRLRRAAPRPENVTAVNATLGTASSPQAEVDAVLLKADAEARRLMDEWKRRSGQIQNDEEHAWTKKVAAAVVPAVSFHPTPGAILKIIGCWVLGTPYRMPGYFLEVRALIKPDADVKFEIGSVTAEIHR